MDYGRLTLDEIKKGYMYKKEKKSYACNYCGGEFVEGQVYPVEGRYYTPEHAAALHINSEHGSNLAQLVNSDTKYNALTDNQKELLALFASGATDSEIAKQTGVSPSTVRRQKFTFREKAKAAKLYLAIFESAFGEKTRKEDEIMPVHNSAVFLDDRYVITERERAQVIETSFESLEPLKLKSFSPKEKKKIVILAKIAEQFEYGREYTGREVNEILTAVYHDFAYIRRYLVSYGFMGRTKDGARYWRTD